MNYKINTLPELQNFICKNWNQVNEYIDNLQKKVIVPFYCSVDIRESLKKIAPIDHNMYPAGFNNLCQLDLDEASTHFEKSVKKVSPNVKRIGIIPEFHTKNLFYLDNLATLKRTIEMGNFEVYIIAPNSPIFADGEQKINLLSESKYELVYYNAIYEQNTFKLPALPDLKLDMIVLNHDQSAPIEIDWKKSTIPVVPTPLLGWFARQKNHHFSFYDKVVQDFGTHFSINPDIIMAKYKTIENVDFSEKSGIDKLAQEVDNLVAEAGPGKKVFIKASKGTYGMGIMVVGSGAEVLNMNRKTRNKMDIGKNHIKFTDLLLQEGVETVIKYDEMPAEITIYLVGGKPVGGFMRANKDKGVDENLNSKGMVFAKFCISEIRQNQDHKAKEATYSVIARLATLANGMEIQEIL